MIEAIICTQCGSGGVQEVKTNTYFCDHCETVFKHTPPQTAVGANHGGCQVDDCGVPAIGRCRSCRRRFCLTHQGVEFGSHREVRTRHLDWCGPCLYEQTHRPDAQLVAAVERVKTASTAEELMGALAAPIRFRGKGALPIDSALVLDAWQRLGAAHQLPETSLELARVTHRQTGKSLIKKHGATVYIFDCAEAERLGPVWFAPLALKRYETRTDLDAVVDRDGVIYRVSFGRGTLNPFDIKDESLVVTTVGESVGLPSRAKCTTSGLPINGDQLMLANYDDAKRTTGVFMGKLEPAAFAQVAYGALEHHGVTPSPVGPASAPPDMPTAPSLDRALSARAAHVESLVAGGRLSPEQASATIVNGRVSDRDWERVREL